jgi:hypothetical protein
MTITDVCLIRYHDGTAKPNWGGRATSLALGRLVTSDEGRRFASAINGDVIVSGFGGGSPPPGARRVISALSRRVRRRASGPLGLEVNLPDYERVEQMAANLLEDPAPSPRAAQIRAALLAADEVWMNGEGDFILAPRRTLLRTLTLLRAGRLLGKPVRLINSILSPPPGGPPHPAVVDAVAAELAGLASVAYRDPMSLRLHRELFPRVDASWAPDALFLWAPDAADVVAAEPHKLLFGPQSEGLPPAVQELLGRGAPYVVVSGSSAITSGHAGEAAAAVGLRALLAGLRAEGWPPIVTATCSGDDWMLPVAEADGVPVVPARTSLASGLLLLSRAACFTSGRYHPSILAAVAGTPVALMASNSHKTQSLLEVLRDPDRQELPFLSADGVGSVVAATCELAAEADRRRSSRLSMAAELGREVLRVLPGA